MSQISCLISQTVMEDFIFLLQFDVINLLKRLKRKFSEAPGAVNTFKGAVKIFDLRRRSWRRARQKVLKRNGALEINTNSFRPVAFILRWNISTLLGVVSTRMTPPPSPKCSLNAVTRMKIISIVRLRPSHPPDLNPTEHLWDFPKEELFPFKSGSSQWFLHMWLRTCSAFPQSAHAWNAWIHTFIQLWKAALWPCSLVPLRLTCMLHFPLIPCKSLQF